jgi:hypothetical protein
MARFHFRFVDHDQLLETIGHPVDDRSQALAVAQRLAIDIAENRPQYLDTRYAVAVIDEAGREIHRESIESAEKSS